MDFSKPLAVDIRVRNGLMVQAIAESGKTVMQIHNETGIGINAVYGLINMKTSPLNKSNEWTKAASVLSAYLGYSPEDLFPEQTWAPLVENQKTLFGNFNRAQISRRTDTAYLVDSRDLSSGMEDVLNCLRPRERRIVEKRYGIGHGVPMTLKEVGSEEGISPEHVRAIEIASLRKIRYRRIDKAFELKGIVEDLDRKRDFSKVVDDGSSVDEEA